MNPIELNGTGIMASTGIYVQVRDASALQAAVARAGQIRHVAAAANCSASFLCELGTGRRARARAEVAERVERVLGVDRGSLFELTPDDVALLAPFLRVPCLPVAV